MVYVLYHLIPTHFRDLLDVKLVIAAVLPLESILRPVHYVEYFRPKFFRFICVVNVPELVFGNQPEMLTGFVQPDDADRTEHTFHVDEAAAEIGKKPLLNVPLDDIALGVKRLAGGPSLVVN